MPTLLKEKGFKFFFYANEHEPMHIHVMKGDDFAKVNLEDMKVVRNCLKPKDLKTALTIISDHRDEFKRRWHEWFD